MTNYKKHFVSFALISTIAYSFISCANVQNEEILTENPEPLNEEVMEAEDQQSHISKSILSKQSQKNITALVIEYIENFHFRGKTLNDALSVEVFNEYIKSLDPNRLYFLASDIEEFKAHENQFDDFLKKAQLDVPFEIYHRFIERLQDRIEFALTQLETTPDFNVNETFLVDRENAPWLTEANYDDIWRKKVKSDYLNLKLNEKSDEDIHDDLSKRYTNALRRSSQMNDDDIFQLFLNAYTSVIEPHTTYFSPRVSENFQIQMSLSLEGIGAVLQTEDEYTKVRSVVRGGPAAQSGQISAGDFIIGVAQDYDGEMESVIGWRVDDVVEKIRGPRGSIVRLEVQPKLSTDGKTKEVVIVRDKINLEDQAAQAKIIERDSANGEAEKIGVIELPTFYRDFEAFSRGEKSYRSTTRDVRRLIGELQNEGIDGLIIDLRNNGGGALDEANALTGLFIKSGPIVQVFDSEGNLDINMDPDNALVYDGPLSVIVNRNSASASEIFAAAIQDYKRGIVVGEPTYGKGTVQQLIDLTRAGRSFFSKPNEPLGQLKMTIAQFYRINGGSTQYKGVIPDIIFPTVSEVEYGERALNNALPWTSIDKAMYQEYPGRINSNILLKLDTQHKERIKNNPGFKYLVSEIEMFDELDNRKSVSLLLNERKSKADERLEQRLSRYNAFKVYLGENILTKEEFLAQQEEDELDEEDDEEISEGISIDSKIKEDVLLDETSKILQDYIHLNT